MLKLQHHFSLKILGLVVILFFTRSGYSQSDIRLNFSPPQGTRYISTYEFTTVTQQEIMGISQESKSTNLFVIESVVEEKQQNYSIISVQYKRFAFEDNNNNESYIHFDTESEENQEGVEYLQAMLDKTFKIRISSRGRLEEVSGTEEIKEDILDGLELDSSEYQLYKSFLNSWLNAEDLKYIFSHFYPVYPDEKIEIGDQWEYVSKSSVTQINLYFSSLAKLIDHKKNKAVIQIDSKITSTGDTEMDVSGMKTVINISEGKEVSEITIDSKTGIAVEGVKKQDVSGKMKIDASEFDMGVMEIPVIINTSIGLSVSFLN